MDSANNSSSLQSSSAGGDDEFDSRSFFATANSISSASATNLISNSSNSFGIVNTTADNSNTNNFPFFDSYNFLDPAASASASPLLSPRPPAKPPAPAPRTSSRKRSRASRRAPTTVLTTDTSNFRAMVQEFTGIPAPPFASSPSSSSYPPPRSRFDFFNPAAGASTSHFLLKPYPHKPFQFPNLNAPTATNSTSTSYHLPPPPSSSFPLGNLQSVLQSQIAAKAQMMPPTSTAAGDYGPVGDLGQLIGSGWRQDAGSDPTATQLIRQQVSSGGSCKLNYSAAGAAAAAAAAAEYGAEKGGDARGEGLVESWICSSD